jgi:predicted permease
MTIALGVGANSAVFSVVRGVLLRPLPFVEPERLVAVYENNTRERVDRTELAAGDYVDYRRDQKTLTDIGVVSHATIAYRGSGDPVALDGLRFSASVFGILGVRPMLGRTFAPDEDKPGRTGVLVLAYATWRSVFGGDSSIVGRRIETTGTPMTVIGVMPPHFTFGGDEQFWMPFNLQRQLDDANLTRKYHNMVGVARLRPGATPAAAQSDLLTIAKRNEQLYPASNNGHLVTLVRLHEALVGDVRPALLLLVIAAACVLLIACANLANLVFSRTLARQRELAVRVALGAGRGRIVRQLLTECVLLALVGGMAGSMIAWIGTRALLSIAPNALPTIGEVRVDPLVVAFALLVSLAGGLLFGLLPAWTGARTDAERTLREGSRHVTGRRADRLRRLLVATQTALTVILLVGAGLLVRSLDRLQRVELGFDGEHVLVADVPLIGKAYDTRPRIAAFYEPLFERLRATAGIRAVGATSSIPMRGGGSAGLHIAGEPMPDGPLPSIRYSAINDDYFRSLSIPLRRGRSFTAADAPDARLRSVIVDDEAVKRFWNGRDPLGARLQLGPNPNGPLYEVVGVVGNVRYDGFDALPRPMAYTSYRQEGQSYLTMVIKTAGDPMLALPTLRSAVRELDPKLPLIGVTTMDQVAGNNLARRRFSMLLLIVFAVVSLTLAIIGTYGVIAYSVSARTPELGVRIALGATTRNVLRLVIGQSFATSALGITAGIAGAMLSTQLIRGMLYGVEPTDPLTFVLVVTVLLVSSVLAAAVPARRATRIDPVEALRRG